MSLIIEDELFVIHKNQLPQNHNNGNHHSNLTRKFLSFYDFSHKSSQGFNYSITMNTGNNRLKFCVFFKKKMFDEFDVLYSAQFDHNMICKQQKFTIARDQLPFQIRPLKKKLEAIREINRSRQHQPKFTKIYIDQKGIIQCILPKIVLIQNLVNNFKFSAKTSKKNNFLLFYVDNLLKMVLYDTKQTFKNIFNRLYHFNIQQENKQKQIYKETQQKFIKFELFRYLARSSIQLRFDCTEGSALYQQVVDITITEEKEIEQRIAHMKQANLLKLNSQQLYVRFQDIFEGMSKESFYMSAKEKELTKNLLEIPQILPIKQGFGSNNAVLQNKYMFNSIILQLPHQNQKLNLLGESGFGQIQFGSFNFWYVNNPKQEKIDVEQCVRQTHKIKNKYLVVKSPKQSNDRDARKKYEEKQFHEIQIVNRLKGLSCALIPRFYKVEKVYQGINTDKKFSIQKYEKSLLSQLTSCNGVPGYNIGNLIEEKWQELTFKKIIYIMSQVAQALRFLHLNKIVHLDLKPENILLLKNFSIKLIDFGQAYHPLVPYEDTTPAYTYPYGCPQIAQQCQYFSDKSDVFSFGIILYELLYGRDFITTNPQNLLRSYRQKTYCNKLFFNPQQLETYGENFILPMLNHLIVKSLSPDEKLRPSITWISVLMKNFLEVLP